MNSKELNKKENLLLSCRFYNGEEENPFEKELYAHEVDKSHLPPPECMKEEFTIPPDEVNRLRSAMTSWFYESHWVNELLNGYNDKERVEEYIAYGNEDFEANDGTPIELKALLWNRYYHWGGEMSDQDSFRKWYKEQYQYMPTNKEKQASFN